MCSKPNLVSLCGIADDATEADLSDLGLDADDAAILASELPDKRALLSLNLSNCKLCIVSESSNVDVPTDLKAGELIGHEGKMRPISAQWGCGYRVYILDGIIAVVDAISGNGALSILSLKENELYAEGGKALAASLKDNQGITELDISSNRLGWKGYGSTRTPTCQGYRPLNLGNNYLGQLVPPDGWRAEYDDGESPWIHTDCRWPKS
jgi:hypothetical protein